MPSLSLILKNKPKYKSREVLLLDKYPGAVGAWSLRKLLSSYSGPLIRAYRASDGVLQDIGFTSTGDLDTATLLSFAGTDTVYVETIYDQSGNGRNFVNTVVAEMGTIVNGGTLITINSKPAIEYPRPSHGGTLSAAYQLFTPYSAHVVCQRKSGNDMMYLSNGTAEYMLYASSTTIYHDDAGGYKGTSYSLPYNTQMLISQGRAGVSACNFYHNATSIGSTANTGSYTYIYYFLSYGSGTWPTDYMQEAIVYQVDYQPGVDIEINNYYNIF